MLSVNIPVYNIEVAELVNQIIHQAEAAHIDFEIRVYDDGSEEKTRLKNREIAGLQGVVYDELEKNLGRSAIRNKMGLESKYEYLLFIDADSLPVSENYIKYYIEKIAPNRVLCGGTAYKPTKPAEPEKLLRWFYGTQREAVSAVVRNSKKGFIITSNNFLIEKRVFKKIHFRTEVGKYGHEDTLLGYDLFCKGIEILHIENPVEHTGLEDSFVFLEKTRTALISLHKITHILLPNTADFTEQVNFLNRYHKISKWVPVSILRRLYNLFHRTIEKNLTGSNPKILLFDLYKLAFYSTLK